MGGMHFGHDGENGGGGEGDISLVLVALEQDQGVC